ATYPEVPIHANGMVGKFDSSQFEFHGKPVFVYHALWEAGRPAGEALAGDQSLGSALRAVRDRRRLAPARVFLIVFQGVSSKDQADATLQQLLGKVVTESPQK